MKSKPYKSVYNSLYLALKASINTCRQLISLLNQALMTPVSCNICLRENSQSNKFYRSYQLFFPSQCFPVFFSHTVQTCSSCFIFLNFFSAQVASVPHLSLASHSGVSPLLSLEYSQLLVPKNSYQI